MDCNPSFNRIAQVFPLSKPTEPTQNNALAANTESEYFAIKELKTEETEGPLVVPDTFENKLAESETCKMFQGNEIFGAKEVNNGQSVKRTNKDTLEETPVKKIKIDR